MLRLLLTPRWLGWLALVIVAVVACGWLGQWQWGKYEERSARAERIETHYAADPVPVTDVLTDQPVGLDAEWTRVSARGTYLPDEQVLVRNRPNEGTYGYEVLLPLRLDDGGTLLVNRGWVVNSPKGADVAPEVPPAPAGEVELTGWVRLGEDSLGRDLPRGQVASINLEETATEMNTALLGGYLLVQSEDPSTPRPEPLEEPDTGTGPHLAYAIQWWFMAIPALLAFFVLSLRREAGAASGQAPARTKVRIWDEEDG